MKIILAPDSFKESAPAMEVAEAMRRGILKQAPDAQVVVAPLADGGDGTLECLVAATGGRVIECPAHDPLGREITAAFGMLGGSRTAVVEMARASGLARVKPQERDVLLSSTFGTGELIRAALDEGAEKIIVGIGGSATNDAGCGMARALGVKFFNEAAEELSGTGADLQEITRIDTSGLDERMRSVEILVACDVDNPLAGHQGAARVYGPQKGASPLEVEQLELGMENVARVIRADLGKEIEKLPGAGAAGGLGGGLAAFLDAKLAPGTQLMIDAAGLEEKLQDAQLLVTGEGKIDETTLRGKTIAGLTQLARKHNVPVVALAGAVELSPDQLTQLGLEACFEITPSEIPLDEAIRRTPELLEITAEEIARVFLLNQTPRIGEKTQWRPPGAKKKFRLTKWLWIPITAAWAYLLAQLWRPHIEPLAGIPYIQYIYNIVLYSFFIALASFNILYQRFRRYIGVFLLAVGLYMGIPMPSKPPVTIAMQNDTGYTVRIFLRRNREASRQVVYTIGHNLSARHLTAPGDWSDDTSIHISCGVYERIESLDDLRGKVIVARIDGLEIVPAGQTASIPPLGR